MRHRDRSGDLEETAGLATAEFTPEQLAIARQKLTLMREVLREMSNRDFEVLSRFYLREQPPEQVCAEMGLTEVNSNWSNQEQRRGWLTGCVKNSRGNPPSQQ